jgi:hypothetical protein
VEITVSSDAVRHSSFHLRIRVGNNLAAQIIDPSSVFFFSRFKGFGILAVVTKPTNLHKSNKPSHTNIPTSILFFVVVDCCYCVTAFFLVLALVSSFIRGLVFPLRIIPEADRSEQRPSLV